MYRSLKPLCDLLKPRGARALTVTAPRNTVIVKRVHRPPLVTTPGEGRLWSPLLELCQLSAEPGVLLYHDKTPRSILTLSARSPPSGDTSTDPGQDGHPLG